MDKKIFLRALFTVLLTCCSISSLFAYTYHKATTGRLSVEMEKPTEAMKKLDTPYKIKTVLKNSGDTPLNVRLDYSTIETVEFDDVDGSDKKKLSKTSQVPAKGETSVEIAVIGRLGTLDLHYPIYLNAQWKEGEQENKLEAVLPIESTIRPNPNWPTNNPMFGKLVENVADMPINTIPADSGLSLASLTTYRGFWTHDKTPNKENVKPIGWRGSDPDSSASASLDSIDRGGVSRQSFTMHPTYKGGPGNVGVEYRIKLPQTTPISFSAFGAMRDTGPNEPQSDGVTFRVAVKEIQTGKQTIVAENHVEEKNWKAIDADLSPYAGKEILLRLIADPGPKRNTTCDGCFLGDPIVFAGPKPTFAVPEALVHQQAELHKECVNSLKSGQPASRRSMVLSMQDGMRAAVTFGENGFVDGKIAVGTPEKFVVYDGVKVSVKDNSIAQWPTSLAAGRWNLDRNHRERNSWIWTQDVAIGSDKATMKYTLRSNGPALQLSVDCSEPTWITSIQMGPTNEPAERVYYGHGYCIVKPEKFSVGADGHRMSTSHVGMEYPQGVSVLLASTVLPVSLIVDSEHKIATSVIRPGTTLSLVPGDKGIFDCTARYRSINPKKAAPGVKTKAGRLCFDIWGGDYKRHTEIVEDVIRYGITDSLFVVHNWQRYGYDNRLPDIWPPNSRWGTISDMQETLKKCEEAGILYGLHDNYIDIYPDAEGYATDKLSFNADGQPRKAWFNRGIQARSYQFRPDTFLPFLNRNFDMMLPDLPQSCYFVDVFSSMPPVDYYDKDGNFHSRTETNKYWGECFDVIRNRLTEVSRSRQKLNDAQKKDFYAPSISEAGHDSLIGHLDGADCQFMLVDKVPGGEFRTIIPCEDIARVPWYDAVNHTNFSLHGVGYSSRYESGRGRLLHGIESDDYLTSEVMTGHALMVDLTNTVRAAARKYWLLQPTVRELVDCEIASVEYVNGDIHRLKIVWQSPDRSRTTTAYINRSENSWKIPALKHPALKSVQIKDELVLPTYGFAVSGPAGVAAIVDNGIDGVMEFSTDGSKLYVNGRQETIQGLQAITPKMKSDSFKYLDGNRFQCDVLWETKTTPTTDYSIFVHFTPVDWKVENQGEDIVAVYGCQSSMPTSQWSGDVVTPMNPATVPDNAKAGKYRLLVGLWNPKNGHRPQLTGHRQGNNRYSIGFVNVVRDESGKVVNLTFEEDKEDIDPAQAKLRKRLDPPKRPLDFGKLKTKGAFLFEKVDGKNTLTPLPNEPAVEVAWNIGDLAGKTLKIVAMDADGKKLRDVPSTFKDDTIIFATEKDEFRYVAE